VLDAKGARLQKTEGFLISEPRFCSFCKPRFCKAKARFAKARFAKARFAKAIEGRSAKKLYKNLENILIFLLISLHYRKSNPTQLFERRVRKRRKRVGINGTKKF
jgi:hypothetical protein